MNTIYAPGDCSPASINTTSADNLKYAWTSAEVENMLARFMAAVYQRGKKNVWYGVFRDVKGKQRWVKLLANTEAKARKEADHFQRIVNDKRTARKTREILDDLLRQHFGDEEQQNQTVRAYMAGWLATTKPEVGPATFIAYTKTVETFLEFLGTGADVDISEMTRKNLVDFRNTLAANRASATTNRYLRALKMIFKAAHRDMVIPTNPAEHVEVVKAPGKGLVAKRAFTIPELQAILAIADEEWTSLIKFGLYTGQRLGDLAALTWADIDTQRGVIRLKAGKTDKHITIPIAESLASHIAQLPVSDNPTAPVHPKAFSILQRRGKVAALSKHFAELLAAAGLREPGNAATGGRKSTNPLSFHSLRHTAVSLLKDAGIPQAVVQELIGHSSAAMSARYTHVGDEALRKAAASLPTI
jgi:integrase